MNVVAPGGILTPLVENAGFLERMRGEFLARTPLGKARGLPADIASAVTFLCREDSAWLAGETISVDGGNHLRGMQNYWEGMNPFGGST